jgi:iron complex outermembrane receptor protein
VDVAATLRFGPHVSFYDAVSYNRAIYQDNYTTGAANTVVPTKGKSLPADPEWMNKFILSANYGAFAAQLSGDYVGKRFATFTNDLSVKGYFTLGLQASYDFVLPDSYLVKDLRVSANVTNLLDEKATSSLVVGAATNTYNTYPLPPRMAFVTLSASF